MKTSQEWAHQLGISQAAIDLYRASDVIDLHIDSFIWSRVFGYRIERPHAAGLLGGRLFSQCDLPRTREAHISGATWVITTNPFRTGRGRLAALRRNVEHIEGVFMQCADRAQMVSSVAQYREAKNAGKHAVWLGIQGANAFDADVQALDGLPASLVRATLVHLTSTRWARASSPWSRGEVFGEVGKDLVRALNDRRIFVDLAHAHPETFWHALAVHRSTLPVLVSHAGVYGVRAHWRNLRDDQIRAVANTGGTIGVLFHRPYLAGQSQRDVPGRKLIVDHMDYIVQLVGEDFVSIGSDFDGFVLPPRDVATLSTLPRLVEKMLTRGWSVQRIQKILGENWLRALNAIQR